MIKLLSKLSLLFLGVGVVLGGYHLYCNFLSGSKVAVIEKFTKIQPPQNITEDGWQGNWSYYASPIQLAPEMNRIGLCVSGKDSRGRSEGFGLAIASGNVVFEKELFSVGGGNESGSFTYNLLNFGVTSSGEYSLIIACPQGSSPKSINLSVAIRRNVRMANSTLVIAGWSILGLGVLLTILLAVMTGNVSRS